MSLQKPPCCYTAMLAKLRLLLASCDAVNSVNDLGQRCSKRLSVLKAALFMTKRLLSNESEGCKRRARGAERATEYSCLCLPHFKVGGIDHNVNMHGQMNA